MINTTQNIATKHHLEHNLKANISCFRVNYYDKEGVWQQTRHIGWTEDNRITNVIDKSYHSYYSYDDGGERTLKLTGVSNIIDVNAEFLTYQSTLKNITLYTSPYLVAHNKGYTKHFYAGSERVCAAIGEGGLNSLETCVGQNSSLQTTSTNLFNNTMGTMHDRYLLTNTECLNNEKNVQDELKIDMEEITTKVVINPSIDGSTFYSTLNKYCSQNKANSATYYYHSDHLGSASWITNKSGNPVQHLQYMPYGEPLVNERTSSYEERFTFTGKERDSETGFSYFGARYYDSEILTGWLSVDPMADKYPSLSPYAYCAWNPIRLVDPNGKEIGDPPTKFKEVGSVIPKSDFIGWGYPGVEENCNDYAKKQMSDAGYYVGGGLDPTNICPYSEETGTNEVSFNKAIDYIQTSLENGIPVFVGVDDQAGTSNPDKTTDHFMVIVGMGCDEKNGNYFLAYDNATSDPSIGTSDQNRLYVDYENKKIQSKGRFPNDYATNRVTRPYTVTQIRQSRKKKK